MGCSNCGGAAVVNNGFNRSSFSQKLAEAKVAPGPCEYSTEQLQIFDEKLSWFKEKGLFIQNNVPAKTLNKLIGIVKTSLNISNRCRYKKLLDKASNIVDLIIMIQSEQ